MKSELISHFFLFEKVFFVYRSIKKFDLLKIGRSVGSSIKKTSQHNWKRLSIFTTTQYQSNRKRKTSRPMKKV